MSDVDVPARMYLAFVLPPLLISVLYLFLISSPGLGCSVWLGFVVCCICFGCCSVCFVF